MLWLWNLLLTLLWPLLYFYRPFRGTLAQRLGRDLPDWADFAGHTFLINAVSAGEVVAITPFILELRRRQPEARIALLTTTDSGQEMARAKLAAALDLLAYFPLVDLPFVARRYLQRLRPSVYITTESELWPNIQAQCQAQEIPVVSLNARVYLHNKRGWRGMLSRKLYSLCDLIVCQSDIHYNNFLKLGVSPAKLRLSGNTKFDFDLPEWSAEQLAAWRATWGLAGNEPCIVAGSTHPGEEELLLPALASLAQTSASATGSQPAGLAVARLVLAPRHIERAQEIAGLARRQGFAACTLGELAPGWQVLVVDRYGVLVDFYRLADVVVLGGTFHPKVGGHNLLEATALAKPVVIGPHTFGIAAQVELLDSQAAVVHCSEQSAELGDRIRGLLLDRTGAAAIGNRAQAATLASRGASGRAADAVLGLVRLML